MITWGNVDSTWEVWKGKVTEVENKTIGRTKRMKNSFGIRSSVNLCSADVKLTV
jgi:hypothetical protein